MRVLYPRKHVGLALIVALASVLMAGHPARAADPVPFKAGISDPVNTVLAMYMADAAGFYAAEGLKVDIVPMGGGSRGAQELQAGRIDAMHVGLSSVIRVNRAGGDVRTIASLSNAIRFVFFGAPGVKAAADLKGGIVAVSTFGSESDSTVTIALKRLGLAREDVVLKEFGGGSKRLDAVRKGEIKATTLNEPFSSMAHEQGLNPMVDLAAERIPWLFSSLVVRRGDLSSRRDVLKRFLKATIEGNYLALADEKRAKEVLAQELKITDAKILAISYEDFKQQTPVNTEPSDAGAANILAQFPGGSSDIKDYVDVSLLDELKKEGFMAALQQRYKR